MQSDLSGKTIYRFAGVAVLDNPYHIDGIYDYEIPIELHEAVKAGIFVTVPFGMRNRLCTALVVELRNKSAYRETKMIRSVCPDNISLDEEMQGLCEFLKKRTLCATGEAVRAMVPSAAIARLSELFSIHPDHMNDSSDEIGSSDLFVYAYIREHKEVSYEQLREHFSGAVTHNALARLSEKQVLLRRVVYRAPQEGKTERMWSLSIPAATARLLANGEAIEDFRTDDPLLAKELKLTSAAHKSILSVLLEEDAPLTTADLTAQASANLSQLRALEKKQLIRCEERQVNRNPYTGAPYVGMLPLELNEEQRSALERLQELSDEDAPRAALLHGVTGSGKTRVMTALIDHLLQGGKGVILLLPEIALTPQSVSIFCSRYGNRVAVIHSALSAGERYDAYCRIRRGDADVVIGTRSAVFAPVQNLGAIIIDEEQEHTYKSDQDPKYHTKDITRYRCNYHRALMLLASATPSLESYKKAMDGAYTLLTLSERCGGARLPQVILADMRREAQAGNASELSGVLVQELQETLQKGEQAILFLNRRGYHRAISCRTCGKPLVCPRCSVAMTYHTRRGSYSEGEMVCHWCGQRLPLPRACPECGSEHLGHIGYGTQRLEEELCRLFPSARILRMDADTTVSKSSYEQMLGKFRRHEADILLGTQMVTKGHDFPDVTLVGVLLADSSLYLDDYRAAERSFAMLTQVIGRAGRSKLAGRAVIQTVNPDHEVIRLACEQNYQAMYEREIRLRRLLCFPPSCDIALITLSGLLEAELLQASRRLAEELDDIRKLDELKDVELIPFGPFEAPVYRVDNRYRMRMVIKCRLTKQTLAFFHTLLCRFGSGVGKRLHLAIDFNPSNL